MRIFEHKKIKTGRFFRQGLFAVFVFLFVLQPVLPKFMPAQAKEVQGQQSEVSQDLGHKGASIMAAKKDWARDTAPKFAMNYPNRGIIKNFISSVITIFTRKKVEVKLVPLRAEDALVLQEGRDFSVSYSLSGASVELSPAAQVKPREYTLAVRLMNGSDEYSFNQDLTWGVLALNTNKSIYAPNEQATISMAVLNELGEVDCAAKLDLKIENPEQGISDELSTDNGKISLDRKTCQSKNFTLNPDYSATYNVKGSGTYKLTLTSITDNGSFTIIDHLEVQDNAPFSVTRKTATRIYPRNIYPVMLEIIANQDFSGTVEESAPANFDISPAGDGNYNHYNHSEIKDNQKIISWDVSIKKGDKLSLGYQYKAPEVSPEFYLLGPLKFLEKSKIPFFPSKTIFQESRKWQIATDGLARTWTGNVDGNWSNPGNWSPTTAPSAGDDLVFPASATTYATNNDFTQDTLFNSITISGSGYALSGNDIILGQGVAGITDNSSSGGNTIGLNLRMDATRWITVANSGESLTINGMIAGVGGLTKEGFGKLILSGANTYGGVTKVNVGTLRAQNSRALGAISGGTEVVGEAALELSGGIAIGREPLTLRGYGNASNGALRNVQNDNSFAGAITITQTTEIDSDSGTLTLSGGVTGTFNLNLDGAGNINFTTAPIAISTGLLTKNGSGTTTFSFPNTYTSLTTVNAGTLAYGCDNAMMTGGITVNGGILDIGSYSDMQGTITLGTLVGGTGTITGTTGILSSGTWTVYAGTINAIMGGDGGVVNKSTFGTVTLKKANQFTGNVAILAGILDIQNSLALGTIDGTTSITSGATLLIDGDGMTIPELITIAGVGLINSGAIENSNGNNILTGLITMSAAATIEADSGTTLTIATGGITGTFDLTIDGDGDTTFSTGPIATSSGKLIKNGQGNLIISTFCPFTGSTTVNHGTLTLSGNGSIIQSTTMQINTDGKIVVDNTAGQLDRLSDSLALTLAGGDFTLKGNTSGNVMSIVGTLSVSSGQNKINIYPSSGGYTILRFTSLSRSAGASLLVRGANLGQAPGAGVATLLFNTAPTLLGDDGSAGTPTVSILQGVFGDESISGDGTDMVTYGRGNSYGLRLLNHAGFANEYTSDLTMTNANVRLSSPTTAVNARINSLILESNGSIVDAGSSQTITFVSGNIMNLPSDTTIAGINTTLAGGNVEFILRMVANIDISANVTTSGGLTKSGAGTLTISTAQTYTGLTAINRGKLLYGVDNALGSGNVTVDSSTLDIGDHSDTVGIVTLQGGTITGGNGVLTGSSYSVRDGIISAIIGGSGTLTKINTNTNLEATVTLTRDNIMSGNITITSGILQLGEDGGSVYGPLGTTAGSVTVTSGATLDLNGHTLGTAQAITINGTGIGARGAIINTLMTPATYKGPVTLGATAPRIGANFGKITMSGNISGSVVLTVGGFSDIDLTGVLSGTMGVTKDGFGTYTPTNNSSSYSGTTTVSVGTLKLGGAGDGAGNSPLGTIAGATAVTAGATLDLNGNNLLTAEPITNLNGVGAKSGDFATGALINSSSTSVTYTGTITIASGAMIRSDAGAITLSAISGTNAGLVLAGSTGGTISGVIGIGSGTLTKIDTGTWTLSGQNTFTGAPTIFQGTIALGVDGNGTQSPLGTVTATVTVYSGGVLDLNGHNLGIAKPLAINGFGIANGGAMINNALSGVITYSGTRALGSDTRTTNSGAGLLTLSGIQSGAYESRYGGAGDTTISAAIAATASSLLKDGTGSLNLTAANGLTGATTVNAGTINEGIANSLAAGSLVVNGGTFDMNAYSDSVGAVIMTGGTIASTGGGILTGTAYTFESGTVSGKIAGVVAVTKNTAGTVVISGAETISSTMTINAGTLTLNGSGSATSVTGVTINLGATLTLDNSTTNVGDRIGNIAITMNGGNVDLIGQDSTTVTESINQLAFASGHNTVTIDPRGGSGGSGTTLTVTNATCLNRTAGATVLFQGLNFGSTPAAGVSSLVCSTPPTLSGGGGTANSKTVSIIKGAFGDSSLTGTGSDMVTYNVGNTTGLRLLNGAGYTTEYQGDLSVANANVKLTNDTAATSNNTNSLILNGKNVTNASVTMPMANGTSLAGNILINNTTSSIAGANTVLGITTNELDVLATVDGNISATIGTATTGSLVMSGSGNVTLGIANAYTNTTFVNGATLTEGAQNALSTGGVTIVGGTFDLKDNSDSVGAITMTAGIVKSGAGTLTTTGTVATVANANLSSQISGTLALPAAATLNIAKGLVENDAVILATITGAGTSLTKSTGTGVVVLAGNNTNAGSISISAGTIKLGAASSGGNGPLGTTAGATTVASGAALDLNGYDMSNAEATTINGTGLTANVKGAILNTKSANVSYSGLLTLGAAVTVEADYGDINLTSTGTVSGAYALTLRGAGNGSFAGVMANVAGSIVKNDLGTWTVSGASQYTGVTTITLGVLRLGAAGSGSYSPLGTIGGGTTIASGAMLDLNGITLNTAEPLTSVSGIGIASAGAITTSSSSDSSFSGPITLAAASRLTNFGSGSFSFKGSLAGAFQLTLVSSPGTIIQTSDNAWSNVAGGFTKEGAGLAIISGQNQFTSTVTVSSGTLQLGANGGLTYTPLGTIAGATVVSLGAVLDLSTYTVGGSSTWEPLTLNGTGINNTGALISASASTNNFGVVTYGSNARVVNSGSGTINYAGAPTGTFNYVFGGSGPITISGIMPAVAITITKFDSGILTLNAANTQTGLIRINGGTVKYGVANAILSNAVTIAGGTLDINGQTDSVGAIILISGSISNTGATATLTGTGYTFYGGAINVPLGGSAIAMAKSTGDTTTINASLTDTGALTINAGTVQYQASDVIANGSAVTVAGGTLDIQTYTDILGTLNLTSGFIIGSGTLTGSSYAVSSGTISANLAGAVNLIKTTTGTVELTGTNTYTGVTTISAGTISVATLKNGGVACGLGQATNAATNIVSNLATGTLQYTGPSDSTDRNITTNAGVTLQIDITNPSTTLTWNGATTATTAPLTKIGMGTFVLNSATGHTGVTTVLAGILRDNTANALSSGGLTVNNGIYDINNNSDSVGAIILQNGGQIIDSGGSAAVLTSTVQFDFRSGTVSARLGSGVAAGLSKTTTDRVILSGDNPFTSTSITLSNGALNIQNNNALGASGTILTTTISTNAVFELQSNVTLTLPSNKKFTANGTGVNQNGAIKNVSGSNTIVGTVTLGSTGVRINSVSDTLTLSGAMSGGGYNVIFGGAGNIVYGGAIGTTSGTLTKDGTGILTLSVANTYTGATTVNAGVIVANNATSFGTVAGGVTVASGAAIQLQNSITIGAEALTLNGTGIANSGAIESTSGTNIWQGNLTLGSTSVIGVDADSLTISGSITSGALIGLNKVGSATLTVGATTLGGDLTISTGMLVAAGSSAISVGGSWTNSGTFTANSSSITFNSSSTGNTIDSGGTGTGKDFYDLTFNNASGGWIIQSNNLKVAHNLNLANANDWTLESGRTLEVDGTYAIADTIPNKTNWSGSTFYLNGTSQTIGSKTQSTETYGTLQIGANTDIRMWNSSAGTNTVDATGSLYSQNHANASGKLYIWGDYHTLTNDYWSYATDFDGTNISGSPRAVSVLIDPAASVTIDSGKQLSVIGTASSGMTTINRQGSSNGYSIIVNGGIFNANYADFEHLDGNKGLNILTGSTVTSLDNCKFNNLVGTANADNAFITVDPSVIGSGNQTMNGVQFDNTGSGANFNVYVTGTTTGYWLFQNSTGSFDGESYDGYLSGTPTDDPDPGMIRWTSIDSNGGQSNFEGTFNLQGTGTFQ